MEQPPDKSCVHYKFKSIPETRVIQFDGEEISAMELRTKIKEQERIFYNNIFLFDSQSGAIITDAHKLIPKNSLIYVARLPSPHRRRLPKILDVKP